MSRQRLFLTLCLVGLLGAPSPAPAQKPFTFPAGKHGAKAELKSVNGLPVLVVSGTPEEIGAGVGALALEPGKRVLGYPRELLELLGLEKAWGFFLGTGKGMFKEFPDNARKELEAMVRTAKVDRDSVIAGNTFFDVKKVLACSAVCVEKGRSATGGPLLARNLDYPSLGYIHQYSLVTVYRPRGKHAFAAVGFPGLVGCLSGINDAGLTLAVLEVFDVKAGEPHFNARGIPYGLCLRKVLEECTTIAEARKKLESLRRTTTINVAVADRKGVAVFEVTPGRVLQRPAAKGTAICTNHFCAAALKPARPVNVDRSFERFGKLEEVRGWEKKARPEDLRKQLDAVNLGNFTLQTMVFEPAALRLHLSIGKVPASRGPLRTLDLGPLFKPEPRKAERAAR
jgi:hypothetical protein